MVRSSDIDGSNTYYRNVLKLNTTQNLSQDTVQKVKEYLKSHITNFKPPWNRQQKLIEEIKMQNAKIIQRHKEEIKKPLKMHEIIEAKQKESEENDLKSKLNMTMLPNLNKNTKIFLNLDVQYDFVPWNEAYLRSMRLDFLSKKDKIVNFVVKTMTASSHKQILIKNLFLNDYQEWKAKIEYNGHDVNARESRERFDIWNNKNKKKSVDPTGYEREADIFESNKSDIPKANYNIYTRKFFYIEKAFKKILDPIKYDIEYKESDVWSMNDIALFIEKYLSYPKDFDQISSFFYNKTTRDIINFYSNFKYHFELRKHTEELYGPNFIRKPIQK